VNLRLTNQFVQQLEDILGDAQVSVMPHDLAQIQSVVSSMLPGSNKGGAK
jgi:hypothetical protein